MENSTPPNDQPSPPAQSQTSNVNISGGSVQAHDIVGGDVHIAGDSIHAQNVTIQRGYSAADMQRLALIVGGMVFATAICFFIFGALTAAAVETVFKRPVPGEFSPEAGQLMQAKLDTLEALEPGERFRVTFAEAEISSYFRHFAGPNLGIQNGQARMMSATGEIAFNGTLDGAGGLPILAEMLVTTNETPLELRTVWVKILPTPPDINFGWIPITPLAKNLEAQINAALFGKVQFDDIQQTGGGSLSPASAFNNNLILFGTVK